MNHDTLRNSFIFHPATEATGPRHQEVRDRCYALALWVADNTPPGRHQALALTFIEQAMWAANSAIACDTPEEDR